MHTGRTDGFYQLTKSNGEAILPKQHWVGLLLLDNMHCMVIAFAQIVHISMDMKSSFEPQHTDGATATLAKVVHTC